MATIIYQTNTGSSKKYAELLSEKLSLPMFSLTESDTVNKDEEIIFIGWLMAGTVQGLAEARTKFGNIKCVCPVGLFMTEKTLTEIREKNGISEAMFFLPGNFHINDLKGMYKMMMSMMVKMLKSKLKETPSSDSDKIISAFEKGIDQVSEEKLGEVIAFLTE